MSEWDINLSVTFQVILNKFTSISLTVRPTNAVLSAQWSLFTLLKAVRFVYRMAECWFHQLPRPMWLVWTVLWLLGFLVKDNWQSNVSKAKSGTDLTIYLSVHTTLQSISAHNLIIYLSVHTTLKSIYQYTQPYNLPTSTHNLTIYQCTQPYNLSTSTHNLTIYLSVHTTL
jgi:hypothetical protein